VVFFPPCFLTRTLLELLSPIRATCPAYLIRFVSNTRISVDQYRSLSSSYCSLLHSLVTSSTLGLNTLLSTLFLNTLSLCSSLNLSDHVSHPYQIREISYSLCLWIGQWKRKNSAPKLTFRHRASCI